MRYLEALLWPGEKVCDYLNISRESDEAGLARSMFNTLIYLVIGLVILWISAV